MQASPLLPTIVLLLSAALSGAARAEYPFDPLMNAAPSSGGGLVSGGSFLPAEGLAPNAAYGGSDALVEEGGYNAGYGYNDGYGLDDGYGFDGGYAPDPNLYEFDDPYAAGDLFGAETPIWPGFVSGTYQPGTSRSIGSGEWFQPLYQDGRSIWFADFRGQWDNRSASEFNLGTGVRTLTDPGWIFGAYSFWDHLNSSYGNSFNQGMLGVEAMNIFWDVRFNVYFPESGGQSVGAPRTRVSNGNVVVQSTLERAYWGMDFEIGNLLWAWGPAAQHELRGFLGGYYFNHSAPQTESIAGPRARLEWRYYDLPYFGPGSRLECGLSLQGDQVRDTQLYGFARLRIPLDAWAHSRRRLSPLHRRMLDRIVRDVDIVTATSTRTEAAVNAETGRQIRGYQQIDAGTPYVGDILGGVNEDALIVVDGRKGEIVLPHSFDLQHGQTVLGGGSSLPVRGAVTGQRATFLAAGTRPTVVFDGNAHIPWNEPPPGTVIGWTADVRPNPVGFRMDNHTSLIGVDVTGARGGVRVHDVSDVRIRDVAVSDYYGAGIDVAHAKDVTLDNVRVSDARQTADVSQSPSNVPTVFGAEEDALADPDTRPRGVGIFVRDSHDVQVQNSSVRNTTAEGIRVLASQDVTIKGTSVRDTQRDGIRLIGTQHALLENLNLKNVGASEFVKIYSHDGANYVTRPIAGITLQDTLDTTMRDSTIMGSKGAGIFCNHADSTLIDGLHISDVKGGILFQDSQDVTIRNTTIQIVGPEPLPPGEGSVELPPIVRRIGVAFHQVTGSVTLQDNHVRTTGTAAGIDLYGSGASTTTDLNVSRNVVETSAFAEALRVRSSGGNSLRAVITDNELHGEASAFRLEGSDVGTHNVTVSHNQIEGPFQTELWNSTMAMSVTDNKLGGNPMGRITNHPGGDLQLIYQNNRSAAGAGAMRFVNDGGTFNAQISGNDHQPILEGNITP